MKARSSGQVADWTKGLLWFEVDEAEAELGIADVEGLHKFRTVRTSQLDQQSG